MSRRDRTPEITPETLLRAYAVGVFPMAESADDPGLFWIEPEKRGVFPLDGLVIAHSLARTVRGDRCTVTVDQDFDAVIAGCATPAAGRERTWINRRIRELYGRLFDDGHVHTVECRREGRLVGGLYGLALGAAFFGESMFQLESDASKVALVHLVARLRLGGFELLDTQFVTPHLARLGAVEVSRRAYRHVLDQAVAKEADFHAWPRGETMPGAVALALASTGKLPAKPA